MKKLFIILAVVTAVPLAALAEQPEKLQKTKYLSDMERKTAFSVELLGRGGAYSLNIDHLVMDNLALGVGVSFLSASSYSSGVTSTVSVLILPIYANLYFADGNHRPFVSAGIDLVTGSFTSSSYSAFGGAGTVIVLGAGYEFRGDGGFLFRLAPYLMVGNGSLATVGLGFGYAF